MPTISLSASFFTKELHAYSDWQTAFWRELLQNAVDANATKVQGKASTSTEKCGLRDRTRWELKHTGA
jgi:HSP90 family molecular chaperone